MGNMACCESTKNANQANQNNTQANKHIDTISPANPKLNSKNPATKPKTNQGTGINEEVSLPENQRRASIGSSVKMSSNSGGRISPASSVKKNYSNLPKDKINPFKMEKSFLAHKKIIVCMIELENKLIATGSYDNTIKVWDIKNQNCQNEIKEEGKVFALLEFEPNLILSAIDKTPDDIQEISQIRGEDIVINLWDLNSPNTDNKVIYSFIGHQLRINCLVKCNDKFFASCSNDGEIIIWDYHLRRKVNNLIGHGDCILCLIRLNNGRLCSGSADMTIKIWNWEEGSCIATLSGNKHWVKCLCQLSNGYILSGSHDNLIKIWDENNQYLTELDGHTESVRSICQIGKTNYIASASFDHTIKIWDLNTKQCIQTLTEHTSSVINVIYHSDGYLISSSKDKTIKIWK